MQGKAVHVDLRDAAISFSEYDLYLAILFSITMTSFETDKKQYPTAVAFQLALTPVIPQCRGLIQVNEAITDSVLPARDGTHSMPLTGDMALTTGRQ